jgi:uncharacterized protein (DUF1778 family)
MKMQTMQKTITFRVRDDQYRTLRAMARSNRRYRHGLQPNLSAAARAALDAGLKQIREELEEKNDGN